MDETIQKTLAELDKFNQDQTGAKSAPQVVKVEESTVPLSIPLPVPPPVSAAAAAAKTLELSSSAITQAPATHTTTMASAAVKREGDDEVKRTESKKTDESTSFKDSPSSPFFYGERKYSTSESELKIDLVKLHVWYHCYLNTACIAVHIHFIFIYVH